VRAGTTNALKTVVGLQSPIGQQRPQCRSNGSRSNMCCNDDRNMLVCGLVWARHAACKHLCIINSSGWHAHFEIMAELPVPARACSDPDVMLFSRGSRNRAIRIIGVQIDGRII